MLIEDSELSPAPVDHRPETEQPAGGPSRRRFLGILGGVAAATALPDLGAGTRPAHARTTPPRLPAGTWQPLPDEALLARRDSSLAGRTARAEHWHQVLYQAPLANDDELIYPERFASFHKCLPHDGLGHVDPAAWNAFVLACTTGLPSDFQRVPLGGSQPLRNPQAGVAFEVCGYDPGQAVCEPAPAFASAWRAAEMVECYWSQILRDVPFAEWETHPGVAQACADLDALSDYRGPREGGRVTPRTLLRGPWAGCLEGPFVSQFLLKDTFFGSVPIVMAQRTFLPGADFMTTPQEVLDRQNGQPWPERIYDPVYRRIRSGRDLAAWVDADPPLQAGLNALKILLADRNRLDSANPYGNKIFNQDGFATHGPVDWFDAIGRAPMPAHKAVWFLKWRIHRTIRPELFALRLQNHIDGAFSYPIHPDVLNSAALPKVFSKQGNYLHSQAYPEGCPVHPSYPSGHSVGVGSTVTMCKAIFDESDLVVDPVEPTSDGLALQPYGGELTVGGELNKLAWNISIGRMFGGIHWRSDFVAGHLLGEKISVGILRDCEATYREPYTGYTLNLFNGPEIKI